MKSRYKEAPSGRQYGERAYAFIRKDSFQARAVFGLTNSLSVEYETRLPRNSQKMDGTVREQSQDGLSGKQTVPQITGSHLRCFCVVLSEPFHHLLEKGVALSGEAKELINIYPLNTNERVTECLYSLHLHFGKLAHDVFRLFIKVLINFKIFFI